MEVVHAKHFDFGQGSEPSLLKDAFRGCYLIMTDRSI